MEIRARERHSFSLIVAAAAAAWGCTVTPAPTTYPVSTSANSPLQTAPLVAGASAVAGTINPGTGCGGMSVQVLLYSGASPLYQTSAPPYGNFELQASPGNYVLVAQTSTGCGVQQSLTLMTNQVSQVTLTLVPGGGLGQSTASSVCSLGYYGCNGAYYPGAGGIGLDKPNVYFNGPAGMEIKAALRVPDGGGFLAAVPVHGTRGWSARLAADSAHLVSGSATYDFLYYDLRLESEKFSDSLSFCVAKGDLEPALEKYLASLGFQPSEVKDFADYWTTRFPPGESYCVYPQETETANEIVPLEISPRPDKLTRVWFLVVPEKDPPSTADRASATARQDWVRFAKKGAVLGRKTLFARIESRAKKRSPDRELASSSGLRVREWGVALIFDHP